MHRACRQAVTVRNRHVLDFGPTLRHERPTGCYFGPRCDFFQSGVCDVPDLAMRDVGGDALHRTRCARYNEVDWDKPLGEGSGKPPAESGEVVLIDPDASRHREFCRFSPLSSKTWNLPILAGNLLLFRNDRTAAYSMLATTDTTDPSSMLEAASR